MHLDYDNIKNMVIDFTRVGFAEATRMYEPAQDKLRKAEVIKWCKMMYIDRKTFLALERQGLIKARLSGTAKNSPLVYSKAEIVKALSIKKLSTTIAQATQP